VAWYAIKMWLRAWADLWRQLWGLPPRLGLRGTWLGSPVDDGSLRETLTRLDPVARDRLRTVLISDLSERDRIAQALLRTRTKQADDLADLIDLLSIDAEVRMKIVRLLGEPGALG
jgi:hypothetical protein